MPPVLIGYGRIIIIIYHSFDRFGMSCVDGLYKIAKKKVPCRKKHKATCLLVPMHLL